MSLFYRLLIISIVFARTACAGLVTGPMLSHLEMREAKIWIQADAPSLVRVNYSSMDDPTKNFWSVPVETNSDLAHTAVITLDKIEPGITYKYSVELNGEPIASQAKFTSPANYFDRAPPPDFKIAVGGAHYVTEDGFDPPYQILGGGYDIFNTIVEAEPELMLWVGNTATLRPSDWATQSGYLKRYMKARSLDQLAPLLSNLPNYATWGANDFGPPNSGQYSACHSLAEASFEAFWPRPVEVAQLKGVVTQFRYSDVDFFMLDVQSYRDLTPDGSSLKQILGKEQIEWLRQALLQSTATFKVIVAGAPVLNPSDSAKNLSYAEREHTLLLQMLRDERIAGLFFISGGKPYGELTRLVHANSYNLHDLTVGPLTANPGNNQDELNFFRMPGSSVFERHFALIEFKGDEEARELTIRVLSLEGKELWNRTITANSLQPAEIE